MGSYFTSSIIEHVFSASRKKKRIHVGTLSFDTSASQQWHECFEPGLEGPCNDRHERSDEPVPEDSSNCPPDHAQDRRVDHTDQCKTDSEIHCVLLKVGFIIVPVYPAKKLKPVLTDLSLDDLDRFRRGLQNGDGLRRSVLRQPTPLRRPVCFESNLGGDVGDDDEANVGKNFVSRVFGHYNSFI